MSFLFGVSASCQVLGDSFEELDYIWAVPNFDEPSWLASMTHFASTKWSEQMSKTHQPDKNLEPFDDYCFWLEFGSSESEAVPKIEEHT